MNSLCVLVYFDFVPILQGHSIPHSIARWTRYHKVAQGTERYIIIPLCCFWYSKVGENAMIHKGNKEGNLNDDTL